MSRIRLQLSILPIGVSLKSFCGNGFQVTPGQSLPFHVDLKVRKEPAAQYGAAAQLKTQTLKDVFWVITGLVSKDVTVAFLTKSASSRCLNCRNSDCDTRHFPSFLSPFFSKCLPVTFAFNHFLREPKSAMDLSANNQQVTNSDCVFDISQQNWDLPDEGSAESLPGICNSFRELLKKKLSRVMFTNSLTMKKQSSMDASLGLTRYSNWRTSAS